MTPTGRDGESGFTLIEVLIALVLFTLIGIAGFSLLNAIIGVQKRTDRRLDRLAEMQRAMHIMTLDFQQVAGGKLSFDGAATIVSRFVQSGPGPTVEVRYDLDGNRFRRTLVPADESGQKREQTLLTEVTALHWRFWTADRGWIDVWPPEEALKGALPAAVSAELTLEEKGGGLSGDLRRVIRLPGQSAL